MKFLVILLVSFIGSMGISADKDYNLFETKTPELWRVQKFAAPKLISPKNFAKIQGNAVQFQWSEVDGAQWYHIQVSWDPNFRFRLADEHVNQTNFTVEGLEPGRHYYWRVNAISNKKDAGYTVGYFNKATFDIQK